MTTAAAAVTVTVTVTVTVAVIAIGRNEGARLRACLTSLQGQAGRIVYVDSGSTDDSVAFARGIGAQVVALDRSVPFTAARARNAGFEALRADGLPELVQFVDGDCAIEPGWISAAAATLDSDPTLGIVTGWRTEIAPEASVYNALAEVEWHRPAGDIPSCGGDMMVRAALFDRLGGFNPRIIASEDEEFCLRVRAAGLRIHRLPRIMTRHDAAMTRFGQWWRRTVRSGHGFAEVGGMFPGHFRPERRRVWIYGGIVPLMLLAGLVTGTWPLVAAAPAIWALNWARTLQGLLRHVQPLPQAAHHAVLLTLSKLPNMLGMLTYYLRRARGSDMTIIEYK